jgi:hypothetical protein
MGAFEEVEAEQRERKLTIFDFGPLLVENDPQPGSFSSAARILYHGPANYG